MAEFRVVMEQARRMCGAYDRCANGCPLRGKPCFIDLALNDMPKLFERAVMEWAQEHPEPRYPSWVKWLTEQGIIACGNPIVWRSEALQPIPADIAEKLGIPPIKEEQDERLD